MQEIIYLLHLTNLNKLWVYQTHYNKYKYKNLQLDSGRSLNLKAAIPHAYKG